MEERRALAALQARLEQLGCDVAELTDVESHVRRHPFLAVALAATGGAVAGSLLVKLTHGEDGVQRPELAKTVGRLVRQAVMGSLVSRVID